MKIGEQCPKIAFNNQHGNPIPFSDIIGSKNIVFFFYPKNFTPGCTKEACVFRDSYAEFQQYDCEIIGVSSDSEKSHLSFSNVFNLNYHLKHLLPNNFVLHNLALDNQMARYSPFLDFHNLNKKHLIKTQFYLAHNLNQNGSSFR